MTEDLSNHELYDISNSTSIIDLKKHSNETIKNDQFNNEEITQWMQMAIYKANEALDVGEVPVGCIFVHPVHGMLAAERNHTNASCNPTRHAEMVAIDEILKSYSPFIFKETRLFVTVEPCVMCASALRQLGVQYIYYGCRNEKFGGCGTVLHVHSMKLGSDPPLITHEGIFRGTAILLLRKFYLNENKKAPVPRKKAKRVLKTEDLDEN